jgi:catechol 2,3-dioxygenase
MAILRIGQAAIKVMDLEAAHQYYTNVMGLLETAREGKRIYYKAWDEFDHHSFMIEEAETAGVNYIAFKVRFPDDLAAIEKKSEAFGVKVKRLSQGERLAQGETLRIELPSGHQGEFYATMERVGDMVGNLNPEPWPDGLKGIAPHRFDHCLLTCEDIETTTRYFTEVLDFHQSERLIANDGKSMLASFLHVTNKAHDIAFIKGPNGKLHHVGFYIDSWEQVLKAADILARNDVRVELTPSRHGLTRGLTTYFFDPSGNRNETYCGGTFPYYDSEVVTWTEEQAAKGIFYHSREMITSFNTALT